MNLSKEIQEFEEAINSDNFLYSRKWRVVAYLKDDISVNGKSGYAMLPLKEALEVLEKNGKEKPYGSLV